MALATRDTALGQELPTLRREITLEKMRLFSRWADRNIHTDWEVAVQAGLPAPNVQGLQTHAYLVQALVAFFGPAWFTTGRIHTIFTRYLLPGETVTVAGRVVDRQPEGDGVRLEVELWAENDRGEKVAVARASARVS